ncbi:uncharacterized protein LOC135492519 [Lineus longissimus]|uniref:uncharacterized protein LOC135492519 n=1 Tax=Lineus longissimus TaxID=88925 RepID=UPI00315CE5AA
MTTRKTTEPEQGPQSNAGGDNKAGVNEIEFNCNFFYISPKDAKVRAWEAFVILTVFVSCIIEVLMATFSSGFLSMWVIAYFCDFVYLFDIIKQFLQAYEVNGVLIRNRETTLRIYGRKRFVLDLLSILPGAIVYPFFPANQGWDMMAKVRLNRIIRFHRISAFFNAREAELGSSTSKLRTIKYSIVCFLFAHCLSCGWYGMACGVADRSDMTRTCLNDSWVYNFDIGVDPTNATVDDMYVVSFYFAMATATSTGYGDISGSTYPEKWFCIAGMLVGIAVFFGMLLGGMTSLLTNLGAQRAQFAHRLGTIQHHLNEEGTPVELMSTVTRFYEYIWYRKKGVSSEGMFDTLPITFQEEISLSINQRIIDKAPIFKDLDVGFIRQLSMKIKPALCLPHQFLVNRGDIGQQMYYIHRGEVEILGEDDESVVAKLAKGRIIGEINLIHSLPRTASIRAATHCDLMLLERGDVHELLPHYADVAKKLHDLANTRIFNAKPLQMGGKEATGKRKKRRKASAKNNQMEAIVEDKDSEPAMKYRPPSAPATDHGVHSIMERRSSLMYDEGQATIVHRHSVTNEDGLEIIDDRRLNAPSAMTPTEELEEEEEDFSELIEVHRPTLTRRCWDAVSDAFTTITTTLINPKSKGYKNWEMFVVAVAFLIAVYNTFLACFAGFQEDSGYGSPSFGYILIAVGYILDFFLWSDVVVNLRTAVYTPNGIMQSEKEIIRNYAKNYLFVDLVSILPIELICLAAQTTQQKWILFAFLKLNRLIKVVKAADHFQKLEASLDQDIVSIRMAKCIVYISLLSHCFACVWFLSGCSGDACRSMSWVTHINLFNTDANVNIGMRYVQSLYWAAATMTSTGYGDISAHTTLGRVVCIVAMLIGLLLYGYCLSIIAATLANMDSAKVTYQAKLFAVKEFMTENKLNESVREKVIECLVRQFATTRGEFIPGGRPLLYDVPFGLQLDIANKDAVELVGMIPLFRNLEERFLRMLTLKAKGYLFTPGDIMIYSGEIGREMYLIKQGYCEVLSADLKTRYAELGPGQYFGELGVIFSGKRTATVRAVTYCYALMITRDDLEELFIEFPIIRKEFDGLIAKGSKQLLTVERLHHTAEKSESVVHSIMDVIESDEEVKRQKTEDALEEESKKSKLKESIRVFHKRENGVLDKEYLKPFSLLNLFQKILALCLLRWTFLPTGKWLEAWTVFRVLLAIVVTCTLPIHIAFFEQNIAMWVIMYTFDLICLLDIYINFHIAFYNENNLLITHPISTAKQYAKTNFFIDLLAVLPIELFVLAAFPTIEASTVQLFALARINRLIQVYRLPMAFNFLESRIEKETGTFRKIKFAFYTVIFLIILNCCLFMMACPPDLFIADDVEYVETGSGHRCRANTWLSRSGYDLSQADVTTLFVISIYWSTATTVSVGYGDIHATAGIDIIEMVVALSAMIIGVVFFGYIIASVAASLANADAQRARFQKKLEMINKFLKDQQVNDKLANRVISYYEYIWIRTKGVDPDTLFDGLPLSLWADVTYSLYREIIGKVALFEGTEVSFMKMLSRCIKPVLYQKGDYVVRKFDIGSEMFFINRGVVDVVSEDGSIVFASMKAGAFFGEVALLFTCPRTASIRAKTNVDMFVLSKGDLDSVLQFYPEIKEQVYKVAEERRSAAAAREKKGLDKPKAKTIIKKPIPSITNDDKDRSETSKTDNEEKNKDGGGAKEELGSPVKEKTQASNTDNNTNQNAGDSDKKEDPKEGEGEAEPKPGPCRRLMERLDKMNRFTINPAGKFMQYFSMCTTISAMIVGWTIGFQAAFQDHHPAIMVLNYLAEVIFVAQIYVNFHLSFRDKYGDLVEDFHAVYMNYLKTPKGFALDFIATFPLDIFALAAPADSQLKVLSYLRIIHLLHLYHPFKWLGRWEKELNADVLTVRLLRSVFELGLVIHYFASIWYSISCPGNVCLSSQTSHTWTSSIAADYHLRDSSLKYCDSVYWAVATMTSTGYGDISAHSVFEMLYASLVMICGKLLFGFVLGNIASTLSNEEAQRTEYDNKLSAITSHLVDQEVPTTLTQRVVGYFNYLWIRNQGVDPKGLFKDAPYCMIAELTLEMSSDMFAKINLLNTAEDAFFRLLAEKIDIGLYMPGDNIIKKGDIITGLFYVYKGEVEIETSEGTYNTIKEKETFGEENLLHQMTSKVTVCAKTHVDLFNLSKKDLDEVLEHYPELRVEVNELGHDMFGITFAHDGE